MKKSMKCLVSICIAITVLVLSIPAIAAADTTAVKGSFNINGKADIPVGKTIKFTLYLADASTPIEGFEMRLFYDKDYLEYQKGSLKFDKFSVVVYNEKIPGRIPANYSAITNLPDFSSKGQFLSADFKVLKAGKANISYFFTELYGANFEVLSTYTFTYDVTVDDKKVIENAVPPVNTDQNTLDNNQGDFINYSDGKGDGNKSDNHEAVMSENGTLTPYVAERVQTITKEVTTEKSGKSRGISSGLLVILIALPLVIGAIVAAVVIVNVRNKKQNAQQDKDKTVETE